MYILYQENHRIFIISPKQNSHICEMRSVVCYILFFSSSSLLPYFSYNSQRRNEEWLREILDEDQ